MKLAPKYRDSIVLGDKHVVPALIFIGQYIVISRITLRVRKLLLLIPTDPEVQDALDNFVPKESSVWSHQVHQTVAGHVVTTDAGR